MKVLISSCDTNEGIPGVLQQKVEKLKYLYERSDKRHTLVNSAESADIILVVFVREDSDGSEILRHDLINKYPSKCFSLTDADAPLFLHHGIYCSTKKSILTMGRIRTGAYTAYADRFLNPYVQGHVVSTQNRVAKKYLLSFMGRNCSDVREIIFRLDFNRRDILIEDSSSFDLWHGEDAGRMARQKYFYDVLVSSKFSLCPRGSGATSLRLFESMQVGVAPVIISDGWLFPRGPRWRDFSIVLKQKHIRDLEKVVQSYENSYAEMGVLARTAFETYFAESRYFNYVIANCLSIMRAQRIPEALYWKSNRVLLSLRKGKAKLRLLRRSRAA